MSARVLDGQALARRMQDERRPQVAAFTAQHGRPPVLGIVLIGNDPTSQVYVCIKVSARSVASLCVILQRLPATAILDDTLALVERLISSTVHNGMLDQSPLPFVMRAGSQQRVFDT